MRIADDRVSAGKQESTNFLKVLSSWTTGRSVFVD
jgi:hypothetical protein